MNIAIRNTASAIPFFGGNRTAQRGGIAIRANRMESISKLSKFQPPRTDVVMR